MTLKRMCLTFFLSTMMFVCVGCGFMREHLHGSAEKTPTPARFIEITGWGGGAPEKMVPLAADAGFTEIVVWNNSPKYLRSLVKVADKYDIGVYSSIYLNNVRAWKKLYPNTSPPLQKMNEEEYRCLKRIKGDKTKGKSNYQYGGEPFQTREVLIHDLLCPHHEQVGKFFQKQIRDIASVKGIKGVAFDYFGYQNYRCCYCPHSMKLFDQFRRQHETMPYEEALEKFSLQSLVKFNNDLADYVRSLDPKLKVITHVYPVFLPEPLYGNRLNVDVCGQTAAWFFEPFWSYEKIRAYSRVIFGQEKAYFQRCEGSALIGIHKRPKYVVKSYARVTREFQTILEGGGDRIQVCSMNDVIRDPELRRIFRKFSPRSISHDAAASREE